MTQTIYERKVCVLMANEDKIKALDSMITKLDKDYGKGTVMKLGDKPNVGMDAVPTGSLLLDKALGIGGIPKGRIIEIYGPESSGKCLTEDSLVLTPEGYKTITEIFKENNLETECVEKIIPVKYPLINKDGNIENTKNFTFNGRKKVNKITTKTGLKIKGTLNHPLLVINEDGLIVWREIKNIKQGDVLVTRKGDKIASNIKKISKDEAMLLGMLVADGTFSENRLEFTNDNEWIKEFFLNTIKDIEEFRDIEVKEYENNDKGSINYHINSKEKVTQFYDRHGLSPSIAKDKYVPDTVRASDIETQKAFLSGYFECESCLNKDNSIEVTSASETLIREIQLMLKNIGVVSFLTDKKAKEYEDNAYYTLSIYGKYVKVFKDEIDYSTKDITDIDFIEDRIPNIKNLVISYYNTIDPCARTRSTNRIVTDLVSKDIECSKDKLLTLLQYEGNLQLKELLLQYTDDNLYFDKVDNNEYIGDLPTFDVEMEDTHTFICESIVNHNTTLTLHVIAEVQKAGGIAGFVDAEHALDPVYAKNIGVDVDNLYVSQPDCGEQALEVVEAFVRSGAMDIVVVDSVAALTPKKELEGDMGDATIGLQARLMSQALRKLTAIVSKTNCTVVFINQLREKIGVMFGSPETTTGGRALKFYSSVRIDIRRIETIKKGGESYGNRVRAKIVKNKVAPPFTEAVFDIVFGKGIDSDGEVVDIGADLGLIIKSGAWYSLPDGTKLGQGKENAKEYLTNNPEILSSIKAQIVDSLKADSLGAPDDLKVTETKE